MNEVIENNVKLGPVLLDNFKFRSILYHSYVLTCWLTFFLIWHE